MKKFYLLFMIMFAFVSFSMGQTIENFESIKMNHFSAGANGSVTVVPNPDPSGINTSANVAKWYVVQMVTLGQDGMPLFQRL